MPLPRRRLFAALLVVCLGTLTAPLDSAVNIAFPSITSAFGLEQAGIRWFGALLLAAVRPEMEYAAAVTGALLVGGLACFAAFIVHESRHDDPIISPSLFKDPGFLTLNLAGVAVNLAGFAVMLLVPFHLSFTDAR
jgi:hypothetical protein